MLQINHRLYHTTYKRNNLFKNDKIIDYISGPMGAKFQENLKQQWINFCMSNQDYGFFTLVNNNLGYLSKDLSQNLNEIKHLCNSQVPFGINFINRQDFKEKDSAEGLILQSLIFISPIDSQHMYFQWLRQRKIWWSKVIVLFIYRNIRIKVSIINRKQTL